MKQLHKIIVILCLLFAGHQSFAQDPQFSQFYANPLHLSPSFSGSTNGSRMVMNYRNQWPQIPGTFVTYDVSFDHFFPKIKSGFGLMFLSDQAGTARLCRNQVGMQYAYVISVNQKWQIRPGVQFSRMYQTIDFSKLTFGDQLSLNGNAPTSVEMHPLEKNGYFDATVSVLGYSDKYWAGLTIDHLMRPNQAFNGENESVVPVKYSLFGGYKLRLDKEKNRSSKTEENINFYALYKAQGKYDQLDVGFYYVKTPLLIGLWYRGIPVFKKYKSGYGNNDAFVLLAGVKVKNYTIGYSYDMTLSRLSMNSGGAHELSFSVKAKQKVRKKKPTEISCPEF